MKLMRMILGTITFLSILVYSAHARSLILTTLYKKESKLVKATKWDSEYETYAFELVDANSQSYLIPVSWSTWYSIDLGTFISLDKSIVRPYLDSRSIEEKRNVFVMPMERLEVDQVLASLNLSTCTK